MKGPVIFQMWMLLLLTLSRVGRAQVATAKVLRGTSRREDLYHKEENLTVSPAGGVILSPRYPNAYPRNLLLSWKLLSPPGSQIHLEFDGQFGLEDPENGVCRYDYIELEDQSETSTIIWGRWCGQKTPPSLTSKTNKLRITFKSDDYFVAKPGFKAYYSLVIASSLPASNTNWEAVTAPIMSDMAAKGTPTTAVPLSLEDLDKTIAAFDTVEQLLKSLNPETWRQDLDSIYSQTYIYYRSRAYHLASKHNKVDLNRLYDDVKRYSCTPRNYSVNLREELKATNAVFFPRCLLVQRCGGNCGCGTNDWNTGCTCRPSKTSTKLHEVLKYAPQTSLYKNPLRQRLRWVIDEIFLSHHETCECSCPFQSPR
ncbi:platelet-derived growth factor D [Nothobranchius furzeri]|uniref:Platelet-derived growth factor D n=4 Tax=Nothobranchius TaxID=28779 RepID=A0A1A8B541_NOTFU|nr:platelet-derived growth factor D [Nothobranchius furzeri]KAF7219080.1 platelet derived growth factor D [Nothobranchius furzeri]